jgi:hypothetical protein
LRFLIRVRAPETPPEKLLGSLRAIARTLGLDPRNPKWTSYGALELDLFSNTSADFDIFVKAVSPLAYFEFTKDLNVPPIHREEVELFAEARELFNAERYWECHEVLEGVWRLKEGEEKRLIQGVILVCAGLVHHQKGEPGVAVGVLRRSLLLLDSSRGEVAGIDLPRLRRNVQSIVDSGEFATFRV